MLVIIADAYDDPSELAARRDRFTSLEFSYSVATDERSGIVLLLPEGRPLKVGGALEDYVRIRVFNGVGLGLGSMVCSGDGRVTWHSNTLA
jgi:hypothetical protein